MVTFAPTPVFDREDQRIGTVIGSELSKAREPTHLLVSVDPALQEECGFDASSLWLHFDQVQSIRRREVRLERPFEHLVQEHKRLE